jgi:hypothetical protein
MTQGELVGHIGDVLARNLSPERALIALRRRVNGVDAEDLHHAMLMLLAEQYELIACLEYEVVLQGRHLDHRDNEISHLRGQIVTLCASLNELRHWRGDDDDDREGDHA